jgi:hypothetical protein
MATKMRRCEGNVKVFGTELLDRLTNQAVVEQDCAENGALRFGTVW